jgi:hypothetical protein
MPRSTKNLALQKIESHEKLCRIMQKQTHEKIEKLETSIERIEKNSNRLCRCFTSRHGWCYNCVNI